ESHLSARRTTVQLAPMAGRDTPRPTTRPNAKPRRRLLRSPGAWPSRSSSIEGNLLGEVRPVVHEDLLEVLRDRGVLDDDPGVAVAEDAVARPVFTADEHGGAVADDAFVVDALLCPHLAEVEAQCLHLLEVGGCLVLAEDHPHVDASSLPVNDGLQE